MDRRIKYTKKVLRESLIELLNKKPVKKITVRELCNKADVNRATFYKYYIDIYDLLEKIEDELFNNIKEIISVLDSSYLDEFTNKILNMIKDNKEYCNLIFNNYNDKILLKRIIFAAYEPTMREWKKILKNAKQKDLDNFYSFAINGVVGIINDWYQDAFKSDVKELANFINKVIFNGINACK